MAGSSFGTIFRITTWGESHGKGIGVVVDGCPAGIPLTEDDIQPYLDLRKPGQSRYTTKRAEADSVEILSAPLRAAQPVPRSLCIVRNTDQRSGTMARSELYRPDTPIIHLIRNTVSGTIAEADARPGGRQSARGCRSDRDQAAL